MEIDFDPYRQGNFDALVEAWLPLAYAANSLNYSMGQPDLYPFVLVPTVLVSVRKEVDSLESFVILWWPPIRGAGGGRCGRTIIVASMSAEALAIPAI